MKKKKKLGDACSNIRVRRLSAGRAFVYVYIYACSCGIEKRSAQGLRGRERERESYLLARKKGGEQQRPCR